MTLSREEIDNLIKALSLTRSEEVTCDECLQELAELPRAFVSYSPTMEKGRVEKLLVGWRRAVGRVLTTEQGVPG